MGIPDHLICFLRNLYAGQEATVRTGHGTTDHFQIGKGIRQGCILSPCLFNFYAEYIMRNTGLEEAQGESRLLGEISITSDMQMTPPLRQKVKKNSRACLWKWKRSWKSWLKAQNSEKEDHGITSWQIDGEMWKQWLILFSWAPKSLQMVIEAMKLKDVYSLEGKLWPI